MNTVHKKGFTLIELMIVLAIVAILVALALPSFQDTVRKSRRSDAMNGILNIHLAQERYRANNATYGTALQLELIANAGDDLFSPDGHYKLTISDTSFKEYIILGTAQGGQASDSCGDFKLRFFEGGITKTTNKGVPSMCWKK